MSKRKRKNKFRFQPHPAQLAATDQQTQLPLVAADAAASGMMPVHCAAEETATAILVEPAPSQMRPVAPAVALDAPLGQRLRAAREARGLSCEDAAHAIKLPATVLKALEAEQFERIGHAVFLRGYLSKYLQLLDLPQVLAERIVREHAEPPPLTTNGTVSHPRYLFERYSGSALYLILTGVIVVPAVLLALRAGFDQKLARIAPLDVPLPAVVTPDSEPRETAPINMGVVSRPAAAASPAPVAVKPEEAPLVASMTPFPTATAAESKPAAAAPPAIAPANRLHLSLTQSSWVEVVDAEGKKLEYGLLPAGSERDYVSDKAVDIRIGNADGAALSIDGKPQDLASFRHANVAHLKIADGMAGTGHNGG
ncbi:MAG: helix-turn-helix domain-containing protein [Rudaea sp.]